MLQPPENLDYGAIRHLLDAEYGAPGVPIQFSPEGEDSWAFRAGDLWVSVRRDLRGHVPAAYEAAFQLLSGGLDFVLAPIAGRDGRIVRSVGRYPVVVFPYRELCDLSQSRPAPAEIACVHELIARLHDASVALDLPAEDYGLPFAGDVDRALRVPDAAPVDSGPYALRLHHLLSHHQAHVAGLLREFSELAAVCRASDGRPVLTHGEPIATNIFRSGDRLLVGDWGDLMWGPPERDWSHVNRTIGGYPGCRPAFLRLYDIRWILSEIAEYAAIFLESHTDAPDSLAMWQRLQRYLPAPP